MMPRKHDCLLHTIRRRETHGSSWCKDICLLRKLVKKDGHFIKVWQKTSKSQIKYAQKVFFDTARTCYDLGGLHDQPQLVYKHAKDAPGKQIQAILFFETALDQSSFNPVLKGRSSSSCIFALTKDNCLRVLDSKNGNTLQEVFLSSQYKFKYLEWESAFEKILISSTITPRRPATGMSRHGPTSPSLQFNDHVLCLTVMTACPLQYICSISIKLSIFGPDTVINATVVNGMLIVMHLKGKMVFYNFDEILRNHMVPLKIGDRLTHGNTYGLRGLSQFDCGTVGARPIGLPENVTLSEKPYALFEITSQNNSLRFGGFPWHFISKKDNVFEVRSIIGNMLVKNGHLYKRELSIEAHRAYFHSDLSNCILHIEATTIRCLKLGPLCSEYQEIGVTEYGLTEQFCLDFASKPRPEVPTVIQTRSGRQVKKVSNDYHNEDIERDIIYDLDFDDELDMLIVLYQDQAKYNGGVVGFYDNETGECLHTLKIDSLDEEAEHSISVDRDALVLVSKNTTNDFSCIIYALTLT